MRMWRLRRRGAVFFSIRELSPQPILFIPILQSTIFHVNSQITPNLAPHIIQSFRIGTSLSWGVHGNESGPAFQNFRGPLSRKGSVVMGKVSAQRLIVTLRCLRDKMKASISASAKLPSKTLISAKNVECGCGGCDGAEQFFFPSGSYLLSQSCSSRFYKVLFSTSIAKSHPISLRTLFSLSGLGHHHRGGWKKMNPVPHFGFFVVLWVGRVRWSWGKYRRNICSGRCVASSSTSSRAC